MGFGTESVALGDDLRRRVGASDQLVSVEPAVLTHGTGRGEPVLFVRNPAGISFEVLLDRALDVGWADARGLPLAWRSPRGRAAAHHQPSGAGWLDTFGGGLLATCGLASTGAASAVGSVQYGLHGRVGHLPAEHVSWRLIHDDDALALEIACDVVEASLGSPTLRLHRRLVARCDAPRLRVEDVVTNESHQVAGHMFRHHFNLGYPLVDDGTVVTGTYAVLGERDPTDETPIEMPWPLHVAARMVPERVLHLRPEAGEMGTVNVIPADGGLPALTIDCDLSGFPMLVLWRDSSPGTNVLGVEPSTSRDHGRARAERDGEVVWLEPGESRRYRSELALDSQPL